MLATHYSFCSIKKSSPSCGSTLTYDGSFTHNKVFGQGVTSQLLTQNNIKVFSENTIKTLEKRLDKTQREIEL
jgi:uncharacterized protein YbbK (DUF523 family)